LIPLTLLTPFVRHPSPSLLHIIHAATPLASGGGD
jgi:hypothetical protein